MLGGAAGLGAICPYGLICFYYRDYLTGFHKRKLARKEASKAKTLEREKQERLEARREVGCLLQYSETVLRYCLI